MRTARSWRMPSSSCGAAFSISLAVQASPNDATLPGAAARKIARRARKELKSLANFAFSMFSADIDAASAGIMADNFELVCLYFAEAHLDAFMRAIFIERMEMRPLVHRLLKRTSFYEVHRGSQSLSPN